MAKKSDLSEEPWSLGDCMYKIQKAEENMAKKKKAKKKLKTKRKTIRNKVSRKLIGSPEEQLDKLKNLILGLEKRISRLESESEKRNMRRGL